MPTAAPTTLSSVAEAPEAEITSISFFDGDDRKTTIVATGDPVRAEVEFMVHRPIEDALIEVYFYSIFGNMHCHFSTDHDGDQLRLNPGRGVVEFNCPEILLEATAFNVEVSIKHRGSSFTEHIDHKQAAVLNVRQGKPIHGNYYMPHSFRMKETA